MKLASRPWALVLLLMVVGLSPALAAASTIELRWDANPEPEVTGYKVFVGSAPGRYEQTFALGLQTTFSFPSAEPGKRYYFAVAAVAGSVVGEKSDEVFGIGEGEVPPGDPAPDPVPNTDDPVPPDQYGGILGRQPSQMGAAVGRQTCLSAAATSHCFQYAQIGPTLFDAGSVSAASAELVFVVESGRRVRVIAGGVLLADAAYTVDGDARIEQVVADARFANTGAVFIAESVPARAGSRLLTILRARYVGGTLGEMAAIVANVPTSEESTAPFVVTPSGTIYVAAPQTPGSVYSKRLLAFDTNGRVPSTSPTGLPTIGDGIARPVSIWVKNDGSELTVVGRDDQARAVVEQMPFSNGVAGAPASRALGGNPEAAVGARGLVAVSGGWKARVVSPGPASSLYVTIESDGTTGTKQSAIVALQPIDRAP